MHAITSYYVDQDNWQWFASRDVTKEVYTCVCVCIGRVFAFGVKTRMTKLLMYEREQE